MTRKHDLKVGRTYRLLCRHTNGAIKHGDAVTIKLGDLKWIDCSWLNLWYDPHH